MVSWMRIRRVSVFADDGPLDDGFSVADTLAHAKEFELRGPLTEADRKFSHVSKNCPDMEAL